MSKIKNWAIEQIINSSNIDLKFKETLIDLECDLEQDSRGWDFEKYSVEDNLEAQIEG